MAARLLHLSPTPEGIRDAANVGDSFFYTDNSIYAFTLAGFPVEPSELNTNYMIISYDLLIAWWDITTEAWRIRDHDVKPATQAHIRMVREAFGVNDDDYDATVELASQNGLGVILASEIEPGMVMVHGSKRTEVAQVGRSDDYRYAKIVGKDKTVTHVPMSRLVAIES
jgi:hypothetical protein